MPLRKKYRRPHFELLESRRLLSGDGLVGQFAILDDGGSISGKVFVATEDAAEEAIAGVTIELLDEQGQVVDAALTDEGGNYLIETPRTGFFGIREIQPAGVSDGRAYSGSGGGSVLNSNLIADIEVTTGANLSGYHFAERSRETDPIDLSPGDRPIFPSGNKHEPPVSINLAFHIPSATATDLAFAEFDTFTPSNSLGSPSLLLSAPHSTTPANSFGDYSLDEFRDNSERQDPNEPDWLDNILGTADSEPLSKSNDQESSPEEATPPERIAFLPEELLELPGSTEPMIDSETRMTKEAKAAAKEIHHPGAPGEHTEET